jgi:UDP-N-acetylglucosamine 4-epimerase
MFNGKKHRFLVTGGVGFIGTNLCVKLLSEGQDVIVLDNFSTGFKGNIDFLKLTQKNFAFQGAEIKILDGDIRDLELCHNACRDVDYVLHQAALGSVPRSIREPIQSNAVNVDGFLNILVAARDAKVKRFVFASSSAVYGDEPSSPKSESKIGKPLSPYAITKLSNELYALNFFSIYQTPVVGLRYFNVFGPFQRADSVYSAVVPIFTSHLIRGERPTINGDGQIARDFTFVDNVVEANLKACFSDESAIGKVFNISCGARTTILELFQLIAEELKSPVKPIFGPPRQGDILYSLGDIALASQILKYKPSIDIREGIKRTVAWNIENLPAPARVEH